MTKKSKSDKKVLITASQLSQQASLCGSGSIEEKEIELFSPPSTHQACCSLANYNSFPMWFENNLILFSCLLPNNRHSLAMFFANFWTTPICEKIILTIQYQHNHYFQCLVPFPCYQTVPTICPPHLWIYPNLQWKWFFVRHSGKILAPSVKWKTSLQLCYNLAKQQWCNHSAWSSPFYKVCGMPWSLMLDSIWVCFLRIY